MARKNDTPPTTLGERIVIRGMEDVMHNSMIPYAEHVILERALPRVEDPLHDDGPWRNTGQAAQEERAHCGRLPW